jgi:hypothetical protein
MGKRRGENEPKNGREKPRPTNQTPIFVASIVCLFFSLFFLPFLLSLRRFSLSYITHALVTSRAGWHFTYPVASLVASGGRLGPPGFSFPPIYFV